MGYGSENLIIKQKLEDAIEYSYCVFRHFPKAERFTLVADLKHSQIKILQLVIRANKSREKIPVLREIDTERHTQKKQELRTQVEVATDKTALSAIIINF